MSEPDLYEMHPLLVQFVYSILPQRLIKGPQKLRSFNQSNPARSEASTLRGDHHVCGGVDHIGFSQSSMPTGSAESGFDM